MSSDTVSPQVLANLQVPHDNPHHKRRWTILGVIGIAQLMVVLDATIINIALPSAQQALHFSDASRSWVVTSYALAFGGLLLLGGRISDLFGRKWTFIAGLIGFSAASALGGSAQDFHLLVAARALQGAFGAILAPAALSLLTTTFTDGKERGKAFAIFGAISGGGAAVGLLLGGVLSQYLSWRWCMYVNLFFAIPAAIAALTLVHNVRSATHPHLDIPGTLFGSLGLLSLVYGFAKAESNGWGDQTTLLFLGAGVALLVAFGVWINNAKQPLLPPRVVMDRNRGGSYLTILLAGLGIFGVFLFLTYYMQQNLGFSQVKTGFAFIVMPISIVSSSMIAQTKLLPKYGPRPLLLFGMTMSGLGMIYLAQLTPDSTYFANVMPALILFGIGFGNIFATAINTATLGVEPKDAGVASALVNTCQQVGGAAGTALLSTIALNANKDYLTTNASPTMAKQCLQPLVGQMNDVCAAGAVHGYTVSFWVSAGIFAVGAVVAAITVLPGKQAMPGHGDAAAAGAH
ncbi:MAG: MFS transporter [Solirubrobacterales bacterium]|nr:MFS transporter [Solirubrobacterales bacterium]